MKIFVVSLARAKDRRERITRHLEACGVSYELFDAVDGSQLTEEQMAQYCDLKKVAEFPNWLTRGMIGACLSHYFIYKKIVEQDISEACIIEDDTLVDSEFPALLEQIRQQQQRNALVLLHYTSWNKIELKNKTPLLNGTYGLYELLENAGMNSAAGYVVTKEICARMVDAILPVRMGPDSWGELLEAGSFDRISCVYPRPVSIVYAKSTIDYIRKDSIQSRISHIVNEYKVFPLYQLLKWRRKRMNADMDRISVVD
jgi:glycosyl transferase family 25